MAQSGSVPRVQPSQEAGGVKGRLQALKHRLPSPSVSEAQPQGTFIPDLEPELNVADTYSNLIEASEDVLSKSHRKKKSKLKEK